MSTAAPVVALEPLYEHGQHVQADDVFKGNADLRRESSATRSRIAHAKMYAISAGAESADQPRLDAMGPWPGRH